MYPPPCVLHHGQASSQGWLICTIFLVGANPVLVDAVAASGTIETEEEGYAPRRTSVSVGSGCSDPRRSQRVVWRAPLLIPIRLNSATQSRRRADAK